MANDDIEQIIDLTADDVNSGTLPGFDNQIGYGRVNAQKALQSLQSPNQLLQWSVTGGTIYSTSGQQTRIFLGFPGLSDSAYVVKRSEVRTNVTFPNAMCSMVGAWGRGVGTTGYREEQGRCFGEGFCEVVPGTLTSTGATLRTYIYEIWTVLGQYIGFYPKSASNVVFQYTVLGVPTPNYSITGGQNPICSSATFNVSNAPNNATITWSALPSGIISLNPVTGPQTTATKSSAGNVTITATVNGCTNTNSSVTVHVGGYGSSDYPINGPSSGSCGQYLSFSTVTLPGATNYSWFWPGGWSASGQGTPYLSVQVPYGITSGNYQFGVRVANTCDAGGSPAIQNVFVNCSGYHAYTVSPNPASSTVTATASSKAANTTTTGSSHIMINEVNIYDQSGTMIKHQVFGKVGKATLDVSSLPLGVYIIEIVDSSYKERQQLSIQKQ